MNENTRLAEARDWPEDYAYGGMYQNTCCECKRMFYGDKRRTVCKACAASDTRTCTCHPDDAVTPCAKRYAASECQSAASDSPPPKEPKK